MQSQINRLLFTCVLFAFFMSILAGCACPFAKKKENKEVKVSTDQMSAPARATAQKLTANGQIEKLTREVERGKTVYDLEATVNGQHMEYLIDHESGDVVGTESPIAWSELPDPVKAAAEKEFGSSADLKAMKCVEFGETKYEIEGQKAGK